MVNPYYRCIAKRTKDGRQCNIAWYIDDNKVSHVDEHAKTRIIEEVAEYFGKLTILRGESKSFWECKYIFLVNGRVSLSI